MYRTWMASMLLAACAAAAASPADIEREQFDTVRARTCPAAPDAPPFNYAETFDTAKQRMDAVRLFDNLYFVGMKTASSWALTTDAGIILLDAMFHYNVKETVIAGLEQFGLDPASIRYVLVAHGHNDHFGGAKYLQDTYGARIVMAREDWDHIEKWPQLGSPAPLPRRDIEARDGDEITLGDTTVRLVHTPGHTPGTMSFIFQVRDGAAVHRVGYWGGGQVSFLPPEEIPTYIRSVQRFRDLDPAVDVQLSNHPFYDGMLLKFEALAARTAGAPHPAVVGNAAFRRWLDVFAGCAEEVRAAKAAAAAG